MSLLKHSLYPLLSQSQPYQKKLNDVALKRLREAVLYLIIIIIFFCKYTISIIYSLKSSLKRKNWPEFPSLEPKMMIMLL